MTAAPLRFVRTGALTSVVLLVGAVPAGAISEIPALSAGCVEGSGGIVTCTYTSPTATPIIVDVPDGVRTATMTLRGGAGGAGALVFGLPDPSTSTSPGGAGGTSHAIIPVDEDRDLEVRVGGAGQPGLFNDEPGGAGGIGGLPGGAGSHIFGFEGPAFLGGGGGGGTEVRVAGSGDPTTTNPLIAAGGGGGGGSSTPFDFPDFTPQPGGAGGGADGADAVGIVSGVDQVIGGGQGGTQTGGGAGGALLPADVFPPFDAVGEAGSRGAGGAAPTGPFGQAPIFTGTGAGGGGGGYFGGGGGSLFTGGGGGSGFGPEGTEFGVGPTGPFTESALPDGEAVIVFAAPAQAPRDDGNGNETGAGGQDPCANVTRVLISDRVPLSC